MAGSSNANNVPEGTTLIFGSWACTVDGLGGFSSHLITPKTPESKFDDQSAKTSSIVELGENQVLPELDSEITENVSTPTCNPCARPFGPFDQTNLQSTV